MKHACIFQLILLVFGCQHPSNRLKFKEVEVKAKDDTCTGSDCTTAHFRYVQFEGTSADSLNKFVLEVIGTSFFDDTISRGTPREMAEMFVAAYKDFKKEYPENGQNWLLDKELKVDTMFKNCISLRYDESSYTGGAHGNYFTQFSHFQLKPFRIMWLADFLKQPQDTTQIIKIAESVFRENEKLGAYDDLEEAGYFFQKGIFRLNENFHFTKEGIEFLFNIYEIQPYSEGAYILLIPYKKIEHLLNKELMSSLI
jgi:hypothetical protein